MPIKMTEVSDRDIKKTIGVVLIFLLYLYDKVLSDNSYIILVFHP